MVEFSICPFFERYFGNLSRNGRYSVFRPRNGDGEIQFLIENTTGAVFLQKSEKSTVIRYFKTSYTSPKRRESGYVHTRRRK